MCHDRAIGDFALEIAECLGMQVVDLMLTNLALGAMEINAKSTAPPSGICSLAALRTETG
jgi:hypothetical protein